MGLDLPVDEIRDHARRSALAGREVWCNPHLGDDAKLWCIEYHSVPEALRGSQPELLTSFRTIHARAKKSTRSEKPFGLQYGARGGVL
jgi:hypothetical protein